jgi:hypothetical protein
MIRVEENAAFASRIVDALPQRVGGFGWLFHSWAPRLAMIAIVVAAGMVWGNRKPATTPQLDPLASTSMAPEPTALFATVGEAEPNRTMPWERLEPVAPMEPAADFERSLPSLGAVGVLAFDSLAPQPLPSSENLVLESLTIADLTLSAESISRR